LPEWDSLGAMEKKLFIRQMDVFGAYLAYTDHEIGRVIQAVEDMGQLDNTLIIYISGDNGASAEGMLNGTPNEFTTFNGVPVPVKAQYALVSVLGLGAPSRICRRLGVGDEHAVQVGEAGGVAFRRDGRAWPCRGPATSTTWAASALSFTMSSTSSHDPRSRRHPAARRRSTASAAPHGRREHGLHLGQGRRRRPSRTRRNTSKRSATAPSITKDGWPARPRRHFLGNSAPRRRPM
jgi:hypothetical protein